MKNKELIEETEKEIKDIRERAYKRYNINYGQEGIIDDNINILKAKLEGIKQGAKAKEKEIKKLKQKLLQASQDNDWEYAHDDGYEDGFRIMSGKDFINQEFTKIRDEK